MGRRLSKPALFVRLDSTQIAPKRIDLIYAPGLAAHHIDIVLAGPEGGWLMRALEDAGFGCARRESLGECDAALAIVDWTVDDFEAFVADFDGPVIGVGWDPMSEDDLERLGLDASYARPVPIARLVRRVEALLGIETGDARPRRKHSRSPSRPPARDESRNDSDGAEDAPGPDKQDSAPPEVSPVREPTMALDADGQPPPELPAREPTLHLDDEASAIHRVEDVQRPHVGEKEGSANEDLEIQAWHDSSEIEVHDLGTGSATLSPRLDALLRAADRRLFPNESPLDLRFPAGDEPALALVPDELLAEVSLPLDIEEGADPLEAFTFVGSPDLLDTNGGRLSEPGSGVGTGAPNLTPHTIVERGERPASAPSSSSGSQSSVDLTREGLLPAGGVLRILWQLRDSSHASSLTLEVAGGTTLALTLNGAKLLLFEGPENLRVVAELRAQGRVAMSAENEADAARILEDAVSRGILDEYERDRRLRQAREELLGEACLASEARFMVASSPTRRAPPHGFLARPFLHVAVEQVRRHIRVRGILRWLDVSLSDRLVLASSFHSRAAEAGLEPEMIAALERAAGSRLSHVFTSVAAEAGVVGAVYALASADALRFERAEADGVDDSQALRESLERASELAREGDYFRILGVSREASGREIEEAFDRQMRRLHALDLEGLALGDLEGLRQEVFQAAQDAFDVLRDERLRTAYARAIAPR